jgi:SagB-type dehydrogenase family enzyme
LDLSWLVSLSPGLVAERGPDSLAVAGIGGRLVLRRLPPATREALVRLVHPGAPLGELIAELQQADSPAALARFLYWLQELATRGCLGIAVTAGHQRLATADPVARSFRLSESRVPAGPLVLSRFACLHRVGNDLVLETPLSDARVVLHDRRAVGFLHDLAGGGDLPPEQAAALRGLLYHSGLLAGADEEDRALETWEFHDLLFHARSRAGRHDGPLGTTFSFLGRLEPPPAVRPPLGGETIDLYRPDLERLRRDDPPLAEVMESRHSVRDYGPEPITAEQLGEFLYRVARIRERGEWEMDTPAGAVHMETTGRPYPSGGSLYELELYPVVRACRGLAPGLYHYDPQGHRLERLAGLTLDAQGLLDEAALSAGTDPGGLQVLLVVAARFARVRWKYSALAYALTLKNVGVLFQSMYLAATAMNLAPCALGAGDADLFARATGNDYYAESSVGEFLLGSRSRE